MDTIQSAFKEEGTQKSDSLVKVDQGIAGVSALAEAIGARVKQARGSMSQPQLADLIGVHFNTIGKIERGKNSPDAGMLVAIAKATNTSAAWLIVGPPHRMEPFEALGEESVEHSERQQTPGALSVTKTLHAVEIGEYIYVPHFDIAASAGPGVFNDIEMVVAMRPFETAFIRRELRISHDELALLNVRGRSMEPLLHSRDVSLVDRRDREAVIEGIHLVRLDEALLIKSLQRLPGRTLRVSSHNREFEPFEIAPDENGDRDFEILGRLRWAGVTLN